MTDATTKEPVVECWRSSLYAPCDDFEDDDRGICLNCGHWEECHGNP